MNNSIIAGGLAGGLDVFITMPLDTIKNYKQLNKNNDSYFKITKYIYSKSKILGFYKGFVPFFLQSIGKSSIRFYSYSYINTKLIDISKNNLQDNIIKDNDDFENKYIINIISGFSSGIIESFLCTIPSERLKILKQNTKNYNYSDFIKTNIKSKKIYTLYKGSLPTILKQSSSVTFRFTSYEYFKENLNNLNFINKKNIPFLAGGLCGSLSCLINNPIDLLKTKMQSDKNINKNIINYISDINKEGYSSWFKGLGLRFPRLFLSQAIQFSIYEYIINLC